MAVGDIWPRCYGAECGDGGEGWKSMAARLITIQEIEQITAAEGEQWGLPHVRRVLLLGAV